METPDVSLVLYQSTLVYYERRFGVLGAWVVWSRDGIHVVLLRVLEQIATKMRTRLFLLQAVQPTWT